MTSWQLWRRILYPPGNNALYQQAFQQSSPPVPWYVGCVELLALLLVFPLILFMAPVYSLGWVIGITGDIVQARATGRLDLMALTPDGPLGARVAIALANLHREGLLQRANQRGTWTGRLLIAIVIAFVTLLVPQTRQDTPEYAPFIAALIGLAALIPDHIQSVALSFLAGLLGAEASDDRMSAQWSAFALLLAFQMGAYGAALAVFFTLAPRDMGFELIVAALAAVATLLLAREGLFLLLWRALANRFGQATVLDLASRRGV